MRAPNPILAYKYCISQSTTTGKYNKLSIILGFKLLSPLKTNIFKEQRKRWSLQICVVPNLCPF